ncbi:MAG: hypothetical protein HOP25_00050 [Methylotenera sp.]|nr:hypothetical protein [Methylotenera sp.]NOT64883.1 hypothetical protein [Methylotenera sp.]
MNTHLNTTKNVLDEPLFTKEQCDTLFAAVLVHDDIYPNATLPDKIHLNYTQDELKQCYRICRQMWKQGVDRAELNKHIAKLMWNRPFSEEDKLTYHNIRAKIKHLRFAYVACDERHRYPKRFHVMTAIMGGLQDAFKNNQKYTIIGLAAIVRLCLSPVFYHFIEKEMDDFKPSTPESYRKYILSEIDFIRHHLAKEVVTSEEFHKVRIVISRQVALYDNLKTLYPSDYHTSISQYISTINGLMGSMHDKLITEKFNKTRDYYKDAFEMPTEIRERLTNLTQKYPQI